VIERDRLYLTHVLEAIAAIDEFTRDGKDVFLNDRKTQSAVIRQIEIIGEAVKHLSDSLTQSAPEIPWRLIAGTRDRLIHGYFKVDLEAVWSMVVDDLPPLQRRVEDLLAEA
jgi:uncharacterized protein with HEPN domain